MPQPNTGAYDYYNQDPTAGWWAYLRSMGLAGSRPADQWSQNQYTRTYGNYQAEAANDPNMGFYDYLNRYKPDLYGDYWSQSPGQRGDNSSRNLTNASRYINVS